MKCSLYIAADNEIFHQCFLGPRNNIAAMPAGLDLSLAGSISIPGIPLQNTSEKAVTHGNLEFFYKNAFVNPTSSSICLIIRREKKCIYVCMCV